MLFRSTRTPELALLSAADRHRRVAAEKTARQEVEHRVSRSRPDCTLAPPGAKGAQVLPLPGSAQGWREGLGEGYGFHFQNARKKALAPTPRRPQSLPETLSEKYRVPTPTELGAEGAAVKHQRWSPPTGLPWLRPVQDPNLGPWHSRNLASTSELFPSKAPHAST